MKIHIELDSHQLKALVIEHLQNRLGNVALDVKNLRIEVKSKHNWKAEWEDALYRATYEAIE